MEKSKKAVCFGEVLWDIFPDEERIGGAPLNVASRLSSMGITTHMISCVGTDQKGRDILSYLNANGVNVQFIGEKNNYPTGVVNVKLSQSGSATYEIAYPSAWDKITITEEMRKIVKDADVFIFGTLVCRDEVSKAALFELLAEAKYRVLDFNLRPPHYTPELLLELIKKADFIKFNDDELFEMAELMGSPFNSLEQNIQFIAQNSSATTICVTKGRHGAVLLCEKLLFYNSGYKIKVEDTVGAGDSFLGTLIAKLLQNERPQKALDYACAVGALVAGEKGANPVFSPLEIEKFINAPGFCMR